MEKLIPGEDIGKYLTAFADGELRPAESMEVLEYLVANPQAMARVIGQQRLRLAAGRAVSASTPPVPDLLRERVAAAAAGGNAASRMAPDARPRRGWASSAKRLLLPVGAAVCVAAGVAVGRLSSPPPRPVGHVSPLAAAIASEVTRVHVDCSRYADHFHEPAFPREASQMSAVLQQHLGAAAASYPDLSALGYEFAGAGPCELPGAKTVHLLYRPRTADMADTVSLFLQPDVGQVDVEPDNVYVASPPGAPHPLLLWRSAGVVYYLVADDAGTADAALAAIATAPKSRRA